MVDGRKAVEMDGGKMRVKVGRIVRPDGKINSKVDGEQAMALTKKKIHKKEMELPQ